MFAAQLGFVFAADIGGPHSGHLVGGNGHSDSAAADQNAQIGVMIRYFFRHLAGIVRVIHRFAGVRAPIVDLDPLLQKQLLDFFFEFEARMIGAERNLHEHIVNEHSLRSSPWSGDSHRC